MFLRLSLGTSAWKPSRPSSLGGMLALALALGGTSCASDPDETKTTDPSQSDDDIDSDDGSQDVDNEDDDRAAGHDRDNDDRVGDPRADAAGPRDSAAPRKDVALDGRVVASEKDAGLVVGGDAGTVAQIGSDAASPPSSGSAASCASLPPASDYGEKGPFGDAKMFSNTGPGGNYTLFRPDSSLGKDGFKHPIATWGNGITTRPTSYTALLTTIASHGFVVIASNDTMAERPALSAGLDWLIEQDKSGEMAGKLDTTRELAIGYSWGGGAAIDTSNRPNIKATVSFHGMPPRQSSAFKDMHSPLLLFTSTGDTFVSASGYVTPNYEKSTVQTFYATLADSSFSHTSVMPNAGKERGPAIAWLRFWACGDENARAFFFGDDCLLCKSPFTMPKRKNWQ